MDTDHQIITSISKETSNHSFPRPHHPMMRKQGAHVRMLLILFFALLQSSTTRSFAFVGTPIITPKTALIGSTPRRNSFTTRVTPFGRLFHSTNTNDSPLSSNATCSTYYGSLAIRSQLPTPTNETALQLLSFYHFTSPVLADPQVLRDELFDSLRQHIPGIRGTIYVANEGMNGQLAIPTSNIINNNGVEKLLWNCIQQSSSNSAIDWTNMSMTVGTIVPIHHATFDKFIVRTRDAILRDGLEETDDLDEVSLDWTQNIGVEISPDTWHEQLLIHNKQKQQKEHPLHDSSSMVVLDCRNGYESNLGRFRNATCLDTNVFSESWNRLHHLTANVTKTTPILIYCTGGIRCVKVGAYLTQRLGFENIQRLQHGIIGYEQWANKHKEIVGSGGGVWEGENFLFDKRRLLK